MKRHTGSLEAFAGPTQTLVSGNTLQVSNYEKYEWTMFNPNEKKERRETIFPQERQTAFTLGVNMMQI